MVDSGWWIVDGDWSCHFSSSTRVDPARGACNASVSRDLVWTFVPSRGVLDSFLAVFRNGPDRRVLAQIVQGGLAVKVKGICLGVWLGSLALASVAQGAGFAHSANGNVLAPDQATAEAVLAKAEEYRRQVALEWLGEELPEGAGPVAIHVQFSVTEDTGLTLAIDSPQRKFHRIWLITSRQQALGSTLHHEMVHAVLATRFPGLLPAWADEGIAGAKDDPQRVALRRQIVEQFAQAGTWPPLGTLFAAKEISANDEAAYSVASSVAEFLLSRGDRPTFFRFAAAGREIGWDRAIQDHYGFRSVADLQVTWQRWVSQRMSLAQVSARR